MLPRCRQPKRKGRTKTWIMRTINHSYKENFSFNPDAHPLQQLHLFNISPSSVFLPADYRRFQEQNNGNRFWLWLGFKRCKTTASTQRPRQIDFGLIQKSISIAVLSVKRNVELLMDEAMNKFFIKKMNFLFFLPPRRPCALEFTFFPYMKTLFHVLGKGAAPVGVGGIEQWMAHLIEWGWLLPYICLIDCIRNQASCGGRCVPICLEDYALCVQNKTAEMAGK